MKRYYKNKELIEEIVNCDKEAIECREKLYKLNRKLIKTQSKLTIDDLSLDVIGKVFKPKNTDNLYYKVVSFNKDSVTVFYYDAGSFNDNGGVWFGKRSIQSMCDDKKCSNKEISSKISEFVGSMNSYEDIDVYRVITIEYLQEYIKHHKLEGKKLIIDIPDKFEVSIKDIYNYPPTIDIGDMYDDSKAKYTGADIIKLNPVKNDKLIVSIFIESGYYDTQNTETIEYIKLHHTDSSIVITLPELKYI